MLNAARCALVAGVLAILPASSVAQVNEGHLVIVKVSPNLWPFGTTTDLRWVYRRASPITRFEAR